jgi:hypothetical protein
MIAYDHSNLESNPLKESNYIDGNKEDTNMLSILVHDGIQSSFQPPCMWLQPV